MAPCVFAKEPCISAKSSILQPGPRKRNAALIPTYINRNKKPACVMISYFSPSLSPSPFLSSRTRSQREQAAAAVPAAAAVVQQAREPEEEGQRALQQLEGDLFGGGLPREVPLDLVRRWTNGFSDERKIGEGAFGNVYRGVFEDRQNQLQRQVAIKRLKPEIRLQGDEMEQCAALSCIRREIHVL
eukprot:CAMPEP_0179456462 /NCGR_PEP_ID=MMETSP0799-20121207/40252_1 /TAXON_ID=46947 /ORGANISM="Geminigera cryophila, Strain CCMP2564" /LENGTH=185 /DNA_ID=CAMNT_0021256217 /DNA_START=291 /DNA_END=844 /DNA_ORIENTATION=+